MTRKSQPAQLFPPFILVLDVDLCSSKLILDDDVCFSQLALAADVRPS